MDKLAQEPLINLHPELQLTPEEAIRLKAYLRKHYPKMSFERKLQRFIQDLAVIKMGINVNPYHNVINNIPRVDVVRKEQEEEILNAMSEGSNIYVRGYWRTGKSTIVDNISRQFPYSNASIVIPSTSSKLEEAKESIAKAMAHKIFVEKFPEKDHGGYKEGDFEKVRIIETEILQSGCPVEFYNRHLAAQGKQGMISFDEVLGTIDSDEVTNYIAGLDRPFSNLRVVFVLHRTRRYEKKLMSHYTTGKTFEIGGVSRADLEKLFDRYSRDGLIEFTPEAKALLFEYSGTIPYFFNHLITMLFLELDHKLMSVRHERDYKPEKILSALQLTITADDVRQLGEKNAKEFQFSSANHYQDNHIMSTTQRYLDFGLSEIEQEIVSLLSTGPLTFTEVQNKYGQPGRGEYLEGLQSLVKYGFAVCDEAKKHYRINGLIMQGNTAKAAMGAIERSIGITPFRKHIMEMIDAAK